MFKRHEVINIIQEAIEDYYNGEVVSDKPNEDGSYDIFTATVQKVNEKSIEINFETVDGLSSKCNKDAYVITVHTLEEYKNQNAKTDSLDEFIEKGSKEKITLLDKIKYFFNKYNK